MQECVALEATRDFALAVAAGIVPVLRDGEVRLAVREPLFTLIPVAEMVGRMTQAKRQAVTEYNALIAVRNRRQALQDRRVVEMFEYLVERGYARTRDMLVAFGVREEDVEEGGEMETVAQFQRETFPVFERWYARHVVECAWTAVAVANVCMLSAAPRTGMTLPEAVADVERASLFFGMRGEAGEAEAGDRREAGETGEEEVRMPEEVERTGYARYRLGRERIFAQEVDGRLGVEAVFALAEMLARSGRERRVRT